MLKVPQYNSIYFLSYAHLKYEMFVYKHTEVKNMLKISLLFNKNAKFMGK